MGGYSYVEMIKILFINQLKVVGFHLYGTGLILMYTYLFNPGKDVMFVLGVFWILYTLPALYLHLEYYLYNRNEQYEISNSCIKLRKRNEEKIYYIEDLSKIIVYKSASLDKGGIQLMPLESYSYARILTKSNEEIIITCLLTPNVEDVVQQLKGVAYEREKKFFCSIEKI